MTKICGNKACEYSGLQQESNKFYKDVGKPSGLKSWCISCVQVKARKNWAADVNSYYAYHACYVALIKPAVDAAIAILISDCVKINVRGGGKSTLKDKAALIFQLGLIR